MENKKIVKEIEKVDRQFQRFEGDIKNLTLDHLNKAPSEEKDDQTKLSKKEIKQMDAPVMYPLKKIHGSDKPNPKFESQRKKAQDLVKVIFENHEVIGESIRVWTKPFSGDPAEYWEIPTNTPVYSPLHLARQISQCKYHRLKSEDKLVRDEGGMSYYGNMVVDCAVQRLGVKNANNLDFQPVL